MNTSKMAQRAALSAAILVSAQASLAEEPIKVGMMLPATGTYAKLGNNIKNGFKLYVDEQGGTLGGRQIEYVEVDSEANPAKAIDNVNKLIKQHEVDVLLGSVHSGVALAMAKRAKESGTVLIVPNAGADNVTGPLCAPNIFRTSFSNWQPGYATGQAMAEDGHKTAVAITWKYGAGKEMLDGFKESFEEAGGTVVKELYVPFPNVEFQALLTQIAAAKPDAVFAFFAGGGAVKFVKDYAAAGLKDAIPLYGTGFLTDGTLEAQGADAEGVKTALHYADALGTPRDDAFREAYAQAYGEQPDVYSVQAYDAAQILGIGLEATGGDIANKETFTAAIRNATVDSPRGEFTMSSSHNPVQDFYLREVTDGVNKVVRIASKSLSDPGRGCRMK
ncbi:ABC transporter substrate-binding protein [Thiohalocapsa marina]|nr:ABC transporter substrate-binding protein [Thiohalocapsa marina]